VGPVFEVAGVAIPRLGFGTWPLTGTECARAVEAALAAGYRHVDTAEMYGNEREVGEALRASGVPRDEIFLTSKVWYDHLSGDAMMAAAQASLKRLGIERLDLYLIHWPSPTTPVSEAVAALSAVHRAGIARAVGISNFPAALIEEAVAASEVPLAVNQVEYHPYLDQTPVKHVLDRHGMGLTAYCPLARGKVLDDPVVVGVAERHGITPAAATIAWLLAQDGVIAIPKSAAPERIAANLAALDVSLSAEDMAAIDGLARPDGRLIDPAWAPHWDTAA
jgi:diketogulonate reductase-like aldo/keto reductase